MYELVKAGEIKQAMDMSLDYFSLFKALFSENYIQPLKYAMNKAGVPGARPDCCPAGGQGRDQGLGGRELTRLGVI